MLCCAVLTIGLCACFIYKHRNTGQGLLQDDDGLDDVLEGRGGGGGGGSSRGRGGSEANKRRLSKDKKYGFGGPKQKMKKTDSRSLNDFTNFNPKKGKVTGGGRGGGGKGKSGGKKGGNRPGKTARTKMRTKKRG